MKAYFQRSTSAAPLAVFRVALGLLLFGSIVRFWAKGWIKELYIDPQHHFPFYGFEFVKTPGEYAYLLFFLCGSCALLVALGLFYRAAITGLFLSFTYIELIDKSTYLNHYYFISMICLLMIMLPAHTCFSVDAWRRRRLSNNCIPRWTLDALKFFVCLVYFCAGLAKLNSDWLLHAQPLRIWLPAHNDLPVIGPLFNHVETAYAFSWLGCLYDLSIPFLLLNGRTRIFGYAAVMLFHALTAILFPIGMFPYIMMATALIFFPAEAYSQFLSRIRIRGTGKKDLFVPGAPYRFSKGWSTALPILMGLFLIIQVALPFRYLLYPGELFWTEEGYRFSWRVMLIEKAGHAQFFVHDATGARVAVDNSLFLTPLQEKMMSTQPDMMLQYAHILHDHYAAEGLQTPRVYVDSYVTLNGRLGKPLVNSLTDLSKEKESLRSKTWILPFGNDIKGI